MQQLIFFQYFSYSIFFFFFFLDLCCFQGLEYILVGIGDGDGEEDEIDDTDNGEDIFILLITGLKTIFFGFTYFLVDISCNDVL